MQRWQKSIFNGSRRWRGKRFPNTFEEWFRKPVQRQPKVLAFKEFQKGKSGEDVVRQFVDEAIRSDAGWTEIVVTGHPGIDCFAFTFRNELPSRLSEIESATIGRFQVGHDTRECAIMGAIISQLYIKGTNVRGRLSNCLIGQLIIEEKIAVELEINESWIGSMSLRQGSLDILTVTGGGIAHVQCPPPDGQNPFVGSVTFSTVLFATTQHQSSLYQGPQGYRNVMAP